MLTNRLGRLIERAGRKLRRYGQPKEVWIDVGAHYGETTFDQAAANPNLVVYAFEANLKLASRMMGSLQNYVVLPFAVAETDGVSEFHLNSRHDSSSLLPLNPEGLSQWIGGEELKVERTITVPTIRIDTFLNQVGIPFVDFLKIDAQGADLNVLKSAGKRLRDIHKIILEVSTTPTPLYEGSHTEQDCLQFMTDAGFTLVKQETQSHGQEKNLTFVPTGGGGRNTLGREELETKSMSNKPTNEPRASQGGLYVRNRWPDGA